MARKYELKRRAKKQEETRQRIVEAVVELHEEVGPAQTTISSIAERAGVQRLTVYRHFPDELSIFQACSAHWISKNPPPDASEWSKIDDPRARLRAGLRDLYSFYQRTEQMLGNIMRDAPTNPNIVETQKPFFEAINRYHATLCEGWDVHEEREHRFQAAVFHALAFETRRSLMRDQQLQLEEAVDLMVCLAECAVRRSSEPSDHP
jgi:AcrR family transcriptional regulator